ncbi:MAG: hypothetical protein WCE21_01630 [Candidatus Babeliales bacterium]
MKKLLLTVPLAMVMTATAGFGSLAENIRNTCTEHPVWAGIFAASTVAAYKNTYLPLWGVSAMQKDLASGTYTSSNLGKKSLFKGAVTKWEAFFKNDEYEGGYEEKAAWYVSWRAIGLAEMALSGSTLGHYLWQNLKK